MFITSPVRGENDGVSLNTVFYERHDRAWHHLQWEWLKQTSRAAATQANKMYRLECIHSIWKAYSCHQSLVRCCWYMLSSLTFHWHSDLIIRNDKHIFVNSINIKHITWHRIFHNHSTNGPGSHRNTSVIKEIWAFLSEYLNDDGTVYICKTGVLDPSGDGGIPWRLPQIWKLFIKCGVD